MVLPEKDPSFTIRSLPSLRLLLDEKANAGNPALALHEQRVISQCADLEASTFVLTMERIDYDCNVWTVYKQNVEQWEHRVHQKVGCILCYEQH